MIHVFFSQHGRTDCVECVRLLKQLVLIFFCLLFKRLFPKLNSTSWDGLKKTSSEEKTGD